MSGAESAIWTLCRINGNIFIIAGMIIAFRFLFGFIVKIADILIEVKDDDDKS